MAVLAARLCLAPLEVALEDAVAWSVREAGGQVSWSHRLLALVQPSDCLGEKQVLRNVQHASLVVLGRQMLALAHPS